MQSLPWVTVRGFLTGVHTLKANRPGEAEAQAGEPAPYKSRPSGLSRGGCPVAPSAVGRPSWALESSLLGVRSCLREESLFPGLARKAGSLSALPCVGSPLQSCCYLEAYLCSHVVFPACPQFLRRFLP